MYQAPECMKMTSLSKRPAYEPSLPASTELGHAAEASVTADLATILYAAGQNGNVVTAFTAVFLVVMVHSPAQLHRQLVWLGCMLLALGLQSVDINVLYPRRRTH